MGFKTPPQPPVVFDHSASDIIKQARTLCERAIGDQNALVASVSPESACFANVVLPLVRAENERRRWSGPIHLFKRASPQVDVRASADEAIRLLNDAAIDLLARQDIYTLLIAVRNKNETLDHESQRLSAKMVEEYEHNGMGLEEAERGRLQEIRKRITSLTTTFFSNQRESKDCFWLLRDELEGVDSNYVDSLETGTGEYEGQLRIPATMTSIIPISQNATRSETRKKIFIAYNQRCPENVPIYTEIMWLRHEAAQLLGHPDHASLQIKTRMAKDPARINAFLDTLEEQLVPLGRKEMEASKAFATSLPGADAEGGDRYRFSWNKGIINKAMMAQCHSVDQEELSEYFPLEHVVEALLGVFSHLFGLSFVPIPQAVRAQLSSSGKGGDLLWAEDVNMYAVWNDEGGGSGFCGYLYLDLAPRQHKYDGISCSCIEPGFLNEDGSRHFPSAAVLCSFGPSTGEKPAFLRHSNLVSLFHELGHSIHELASITRYARFHGTAGPVDFAEGPSQFLENWCWTKSTLKAISRHYSYISEAYLRTWEAQASPGTQRPAEHLADDVLKHLLASKHVSSASMHLNMLLFAKYDMLIHQLNEKNKGTNGDIGFCLEYSRLRKRLMQTLGPEDLGYPENWSTSGCNYAHPLMQDYDATVYGYLYSQVFAYDMFYAFFRADPMNAAEGRRYRKAVLEPGASRDELDIVQGYLGKEIDTSAFAEELGLAL